MAAQTKKPSFPVRRVLSALRSGSSLPIVVDTPAGRFVAKLRGAAQGPPALVAEVIVAEIAERLGLPVPERALLELELDVKTDDHNDELADLLQASVGQNLGFRWLDGARVISLAEAALVDDEFAVRVLWLDALVMNLDRTSMNANVLLSKGQPFLIDHGAALVFQYDWARVSEESPRAPVDHSTHLFGARRALLARWDEQLAATLTRGVLEAVVATVPDSFLTARPPEWSPTRARAAYVAFLWKRLRAPRPFVD
jgi:HipA-like protein